MVEISVDKQIENILQNMNLVPWHVQKAAVLTLNRTAEWMKGRLSKEISAAVRVKLKIVRDRIQIFKANERNLYSILNCGFQGIRAQDLGNARQTAAGVVVGGRLFPKAFIATLKKGGKPGIYRRLTKARFPVKTERVAIHEAALESLTELTGEEGRKFFEKRFLHEITRITGAVA